MDREKHSNRPNDTDAAGNNKKKQHSFWRMLSIVIQVMIVIGLMGVTFAGAAAAGYVAYLVKDDPVRSYETIYNQIFNDYSLTGFAYFNDQSSIGQLRAEEDRRLVHKDEVSSDLINAVIATEDRYFEEHHGVVPKSVIRAALQDVSNSDLQTGGSTLTQQLIKNTILSSEVTHERKAREILLALRIERMFSKDQILEAYLNEIYFGKNANGSNIYGIKAAAKGIFDKTPLELNLAEAAYLAGIPQSPYTYSPFTSEGYKRGKERQAYVLGRMLDQGYINQTQFDEAINYDIKANLAKPATRAYSKYPFLMMEIEERAAKVLADQHLAESGKIKEDIGKEEYRELLEEMRKEILSKGYHIYTTIDPKIHQIMNEIASDPKNFGSNRNYTVRYNGQEKKVENALEEVGGVMIDNDTGAILGMIGGRDFNVEQTNHATVPRQPGSAMKPLAAYGPAFEEGKLQPASIIDDVPIVLPDGTQGRHIPANWDNKFHGLITAREALKWSYNIPAIQTYLDVKIPNALDYVKKMGVTTLVDSDNHAATGVIGGLTYGLTVEEITNAYATFANYGSFVDAYLIERIENNDKQVIYQHESQPVPVFSEQTAYLMTDMMRTVVSGGTGTSIRNFVGRSRDVAGKTGTTNKQYDLWFIGYTPSITMGVWTGYDEPYSLPNSSSRRPMEVWGKVMSKVFEAYPDLSPKDAKFKQPNGIVNRSVCNKSGKLPSELCKEAGWVISDIFNKKYVPTEVDDSLQKARIIEWNDKLYLANSLTPADMVKEGVFVKRPKPLEIPENTDKSADYYKPLDWELTMPEEEDPRKDDGNIPASPTGFKVSGDGKYTFTWNPNADSDVVGYRLYRSTNGGNFIKLAAINATADKIFVEEGATSGSYFGYFVTAVDVVGNESPRSEILLINRTNNSDGILPWEDPFDFGNELPPNNPNDSGSSGTPPSGGETPPNNSGQNGNGESPVTQPPSAPSDTKVNNTGSGSLLIEWKRNSSNEQVKSYNIYFSADPVQGFQLIGSTASTSFTTKPIGDKGWYRVTAVNKIGESVPSQTVVWQKNE